MSHAKIDYLKIDWNGSDFKELFPVDVFEKINFHLVIFDDLILADQYDEAESVLKVIDELCFGLAEFYDDKSYLDIIIECEETLELVYALEIQELILSELFASENECTDELVMLYDDFCNNLDILENMYPGSPFVMSMAQFSGSLERLQRSGIDDELSISDLINRFSVIHYDMNDPLSCLIDDDDLGDMSNLSGADWDKFFDPDEYSDFRDKWDKDADIIEEGYKKPKKTKTIEVLKNLEIDSVILDNVL